MTAPRPRIPIRDRDRTQRPRALATSVPHGERPERATVAQIVAVLDAMHRPHGCALSSSLCDDDNLQRRVQGHRDKSPESAASMTVHKARSVGVRRKEKSAKRSQFGVRVEFLAI